MASTGAIAISINAVADLSTRPVELCGAYASGVPGVTTLAYLPFAFFNRINPVTSFVYAALGIAIQKVEPGVESGTDAGAGRGIVLRGARPERRRGAEDGSRR